MTCQDNAKSFKQKIFIHRTSHWFSSMQPQQPGESHAINIDNEQTKKKRGRRRSGVALGTPALAHSVDSCCVAWVFFALFSSSHSICGRDCTCGYFFSYTFPISSPFGVGNWSTSTDGLRPFINKHTRLLRLQT